MKQCVFALSLSMALILSGCVIRAAVEENGPPEGAFSVYFATPEETVGGPALDHEYRTPAEGSELIPGLVEVLLSGPESLDLVSPFPTRTSLRSWKLMDGQLHLDLSEQYGGLSGIGLTIANYCLTLTLCQVEGVRSVYITVDGEELPFLSIKQMRAGDVVLSGAEEETVSMTAALWFPQVNGGGLAVEERPVLKTEDDTTAGAVLAALLSGPQEESNRTLVPQGTVIRGVTIRDGVCSVNFSAEFLDGIPREPKEARLLLYSLVNTMGELDKVESVQILVEGATVESFGSIPTINPIEPDPALGNH